MSIIHECHDTIGVMKTNYLIGIDEVGRGPIAGPVTVCALKLCGNPEFFRGVRDSKKLSEKQREVWFEKFKRARNAGVIEYKVAFVTPARIDRIGIVKAIDSALGRAILRLDVNPNKCEVLLDGGLKAPAQFVHQKTLKKGEEKRRIIAAASIMAKVSRDRRMRNYAKRFPEYGLDQHKGYGTAFHYKCLKRHGLCDLHRRSFLKALIY